VHFPLGDRFFAEEVVSYEMGHPEPKPENARDPHAALGPPDYVDKTKSGEVTLGCGGALTISLQSSVLFDFNESKLKDSAKSALHDAANRIRSVGAATLRIEGHTDNVGTDAVNRKLSLARANAVRDYLQSVEHVREPMETAGFAATRPVDTNATPEGREKNRRVEILVVPKG